MTTTTHTATTGWSARPRPAGRVGPPLLAAMLITLPAVAAAVSGHLSVPGLIAVFLVALSVALLAASVGLRLIHFVDGPRTASAGSPVAPTSARSGHAAHVAESTSSSVPLGRVPVARIPAHQAIDGSAPQARRPASSTNPSASMSQDTDMQRSAPTPGAPR